MRKLIIFFLISLSATSALGSGPIANDPTNKAQLIQSIVLQRQKDGTMPNRCDTVAAAGNIVYSVANTSSIYITATDANYNGVTVKRSWDSDTAYMPVFTGETIPLGTGISTIKITNPTASNAVICIEREVHGDQNP